MPAHHLCPTLAPPPPPHALHLPPPLNASEREQVTVTNMASTMLTMLVSNPLLPVLDLSSLRVLSCGGAQVREGQGGEVKGGGGGGCQSNTVGLWRTAGWQRRPSGGRQ